MADEPAPAPASAPAPAPAPAPAVWHTGLEAELTGMAQNKGWDMTDPVKAFSAAATALAGAQKLIGAPPEKVLRMPEPSADPAILDAFWQKLGAAKETKDIDLSAIKAADGKPFDEKLAEVIRATAVKTRAPKDMVVQVATDLQKHFDAEAAQQATIRAGIITADQAALNASWGANKDANMFIANQALEKIAAAAQIPIDKAKAAWDALSKVGGIGAADAMKMLHTAGLTMGEGKYVSNGTSGTNLPMTREAAIAEIASLKSDKAFATRLLNGDVEATKQWTALHQIGFARQAA